MDLSPPKTMADEKSHIQETAAFEQVTVYLSEDILLDFDPYLFALSGSNLQQYCTLLSWLEMRKQKSELFLETEEGVATPLSLVHIEEEFNTSPPLYQVIQAGDGVAQTKEEENTVSLARLQYNFVQEANLPARSSEFFLTGENVSLFPEQPKAHPYAKGLVKDFSNTMAHQGRSLHLKATYVSLKQDGSGVIPQSQEQNNPPDVMVAGDSSQKEGHLSERSPPEKESHPGNNIGSDVNQSPTSEVHGETCDREAFSGGSNSAMKHLRSIPITHPQVSPKRRPTFRCPRCSHSFEGSSTASLVGQEVKATNEWATLASSSKEQAVKVVEKPFRCPDCGKGFLHRSSIPRHQRLHKRENLSPDSEKQKPKQCGDCGTSVFTKSVFTKSLVIKHQKLHGSDQPFRCLSCDKSYGQRKHLKRHEQQKHQVAN